MNKHKEKIFILLNPTLLIAILLLVVVFGILSIGIVVLIGTGEIGVKNDDELIVQIIYIIPCIILVFLFMSVSTKWISYITIDSIKQTVEFKTLFRSLVVKSISEYKYIYEADYWHGSAIPSLGFRPKYIVVSTNEVDEKYLDHVNQLQVSEDVLVIKFTPKRWDIIQRLFKSNNVQSN